MWWCWCDYDILALTPWKLNPQPTQAILQWVFTSNSNSMENSLCWNSIRNTCHGPLIRYAKLWVAHALGMQGTFFPRPLVSNPDMHQGPCVTLGPRCMPGSLTCGFLWSLWWGKRSRHFRRMRNPQFCASGKRPMAAWWWRYWWCWWWW